MAYSLSKLQKRNCESCGLEYQPKTPVQKYCSNNCRMNETKKQISTKNGTDEICPVCGKKFYLQKMRADRLKAGSLSTCSFECRGKYYSKEKKPNYARVEIICAFCGEVFTEPPSKAKKRKCCSKECSLKLIRANAKPKKEPAIRPQKKIKVEKKKRERHPPVPVACKVCGKITMQKYCTVKKGQGKYCGYDCYGKDVANMMKERNCNYAYARGGKRDDLGGLYVRSAWEANYARYLNWLVKNEQIRSWEYEPEVFTFEKIKKGNRYYTPDFKVTNNDGTVEYHEVKGYMDAASATKIRRFERYYPELKLVIIDKPVYASIARSIGKAIEGWEWNYKHSY